MPESTTHTTGAVKPAQAKAAAYGTALGVIYKALKAFSFYPETHPQREKIVQSAYQAVSQAVSEGVLSLIVRRNGFSIADLGIPVETTPLTTALAQELFAREIQRLVVLPEVTPGEFSGFLSLLALDPPKISAGGGLPGMLAQQGIGNVILNEIDISAVFTRKKGEQGADEAQHERGSAPYSGEGQGTGVAQVVDQMSQLSIETLLQLMSSEPDDNQYRQLARLLQVKAQAVRQEKQFDRLFSILTALYEQHIDPAKSVASQTQAQQVLQQLIPGEMAEHLLDHLEDAEFSGQEQVFLLLKTVGSEVVDQVIRRLVAVGVKASRKTISTAILRIGAAAEPALFQLLKDGRWQVVLAAVAILAELGSRDAVKGLQQSAYHPDNRVRMESIRALAFIGGIEASQGLIQLLQDPNPAIVSHTITWLGNSRNQRALQPLLALIRRRDLLGRQTELKQEALLAVGRIGDRRALEPLISLVRRRRLLAPARWNRLKVSALEAIGSLGGDQARQFLAQVSSQGGQLARNAAAVLASAGKKQTEQP
jgi:hypothetical protein